MARINGAEPAGVTTNDRTPNECVVKQTRQSIKDRMLHGCGRKRGVNGLKSGGRGASSTVACRILHIFLTRGLVNGLSRKGEKALLIAVPI